MVLVSQSSLSYGMFWVWTVEYARDIHDVMYPIYDDSLREFADSLRKL